LGAPRALGPTPPAGGGVPPPGAVRSWARFGETPETMGAHVPLRRVGQPDDIANGILFLVSAMSSWVSGQTLSIDGGPGFMGGMADEDL